MVAGLFHFWHTYGMERIRVINDISRWEIAKAYFHAHGFKPWQFQYGPDCPQGFHAWFSNGHDEDIEIVTFNTDIYEEIIRFK